MPQPQQAVNVKPIPGAQLVPMNQPPEPQTTSGIGAAWIGTPRQGGLTIQPGSLEAGDSKMSDGRYYDSIPFRLEAGEVISVAMAHYTEPGTRYPGIPLDPYLILVNSQGQYVAQNDNEAGNGTNARLHYKAPVAGVYKVYATTKRKAFSGPSTYQLNVWIYWPQMVNIKR